ncbi:MAG: hypothetical protein ACKVVP_14370 [Chloroflexota bacterium]
MKQVRVKGMTPRLEAVIEELKKAISAHYPKATCELMYGDDPPGIRLIPIIDIEDSAEVVHVVGDRLLELQIDEGLPIYVTPLPPPERVRAMTLELLEKHPELRQFVKL